MVLYPVAHDENESLVWADELANNVGPRPRLTCVGCQASVIFRSGTRRPHFAHKVTDSTCGGETALHRMTKLVLRERLTDQPSGYPMRWQCTCGAQMERNLHAQGPLEVFEELAHGQRVPDLQVHRDGKARYVIEVVVEHEPDAEALRYYKSERLPVVIVRPRWETVGLLREALELPTPSPKRQYDEGPLPAIEVLFAPTCGSSHHPAAPPTPCPTCAGPRSAIALSVSTGQVECRKCHSDVPVLDVLNESGFPLGNASEFAGIEVPARKLRVSMGRRFSKTVNAEYMAHLCPRCSLFQGDFFVYHDRDRYEGVNDARGTWCHHCPTCATFTSLNAWDEPRPPLVFSRFRTSDPVDDLDSGARDSDELVTVEVLQTKADINRAVRRMFGIDHI